jgi:hypothetical protein
VVAASLAVANFSLGSLDARTNRGAFAASAPAGPGSGSASIGLVPAGRTNAQSAGQLRPPDLPPAPGIVVVKLRKDSPAATAWQQSLAATNRSLAEVARTSALGPVLNQLKFEAVEPAFRVARLAGQFKPKMAASAAGGTGKVDRVTREDLFRWYRLRLPAEVDAQAALAALRKEADVEVAELNPRRRLDQVVPIEGLPDGTTDPDIGYQWHLEAVELQPAWNYLKNNGVPPGGRHEVVIAVIDTGVDATHEELVGNMWINGGEVPGNGLDDDLNGFVDDLHGCSVVSDSRSHSGDSADLHGHGTHVAGIAAAQAFNHHGGVGAAFNVQVMAVRAADYAGTLTAVDIAEGVLYAVDNGAEVLNMSFGGYQWSQIEVDALEVALPHAVLVAAAGNDGLNAFIYPQYPAALPFVHGVMASTTQGKKCWFSNYGYDLAAPGESIYSTLPGNQYARWSGTSMAAPIVSGIAALMRSYYWQRDIYSSRFLMGGLWASASASPVVNAYVAVTTLPKPGVSLLNRWIFDDLSISPNNDADGRVDAGETIHLAIEVINRSGQANNVQSTLRARAPSAVQDDPYVTIHSGAVNFGSIGPWNTWDNGFIYDTNGVIVGVVHPIVFSVAPDCPNDHVIPFELTTTAEDGWDPAHPTITRVDRFNYIVQRGRNVPSVISSNFTLTADQYWIVGGPVLVEAGATLSIEPGTQVQWGAVSDDPYNSGPHAGYILVRGILDAQGTATNPISFFPSYLVSGQRSTITVEGGLANLAYARVRNPDLSGFHVIDHGDFIWDAFAANVRADRISNSLFHKLRGGGVLSAEYGFESCLFDAGWLGPSPGHARLVNCAFLQDNENDHPLQFNLPWSFTQKLSNERTAPNPELFFGPTNFNGETFVALPMEFGETRLAETIARFYGGHVAAVRNEGEQDFLASWLGGLPNPTDQYLAFMIGLTDEGTPGEYHWLDGSPMNYTNWRPGEPAAVPWAKHHMVGALELTAWPPYQTWGWFVSPETFSIRSGGQPRWWYFYLLRLPGSWTMEQLASPFNNGEMLAYVRAQFPGDMRFNAFLNKYWDPNLNTWMRFTAPPGSDRYCTMLHNYWGTDSSTLVDYAITDYYDNFTSARVDYGTLPAEGFATTFPFVQALRINGIPADQVPTLETGPATFTVTFNRPMNTNVEPFVTFGPSYPFTDFQVLPRDTNFITTTNGWLDVRTWQGQSYITPVTGNGYHLIRVSDAVDAADPWLVTGYDVARFRFRVQTVGVASMTLQANGGEGRIDLAWQQNDYDLVAGYNLYRASSPDGPFLRVNSVLLPPQQVAFSDQDVVPAMPRYYKFTVVTTDFQESEFSNVAAAAAFDTIPPVLAHTPVTSAPPGRSIRLAATATDNVGIASVRLQYRALASSNAFTQVALLNVASNEWSATIPASAALPPGLEYYLAASDGLSQVFSGTAVTPHTIVVLDVPVLSAVTPNRGPATGGTPVTLTGVQFQPGASVLFGGALASNIVVFSGSQITCTTPPHFPAAVDVQVLNTNGTQANLLGGFTYESTGVVLALPNATGDYGGTVEVPLQAANLAGLRAADLSVTYDPAVLAIAGARAGSLVAGWSFTANTNAPGRVLLSLASATSLSGSGPLAVLTFNIVTPPPASSVLGLTNVLLNDGAVVPALAPGSLTVNGFWSLAGTVRYYASTALVQNVALVLNGIGTHTTNTGSDGTFALTNLPTGAYELTPAKSDDVNGISAFDASLVLQSAAGLRSLSPGQIKAADVNRNGFVSSFDAAYILEKAVGLLEVPFPNAGRVWDFTPASRSYATLNTNLASQDFTAVLLGDVTGNWSPGGSAVIGGGGDDPPAVVLATDATLVRTNQSSYRLLLKAPNPGIYSLDVRLAYDPLLNLPQSVTAGPLSTNLLLAINTNQPGLIVAGLAGATPIAGEGAALTLTMALRQHCDLRVTHASINEATLPVLVDDTASAFDSDHDGLANVDEIAVFHTNPQSPDTDRDGLADGDEVRAGTNPLSAGSVFRLLSVSPAAGGSRTIAWSSVPDRAYQVEFKETWEQPWQSLGPVMHATASQTSQVDPGDEPLRFYRVRLVE